MAKWKKIIVAGSLVMESIYPRINSKDAPKVRTEKKKLSSEAQQRMNLKYSYQKLEFHLAANFQPGDLICCLTYDNNHLPNSRKEAEAKLKYFRAKLSSYRKKRGNQLIMFWNTEHRHGDGRWHHHCVINATGADYEAITKIWGQGEIEFQKLKVDKNKNYESLARYMCKEERDKIGQRSWSYTRNAVKPESETFLVPDETPLQPPKGATIIKNTMEHNNYGSYQFIKYFASGLQQRSKVKSKRRRVKQKF